jgi:hypothetical protein
MDESCLRVLESLLQAAMTGVCRHMCCSVSFLAPACLLLVQVDTGVCCPA